MKKLLILLIVIILILTASGFYWFSWRSNQIVKNCNIEAKTKTMELYKTFKIPDELLPEAVALPDEQIFYDKCIREHGLIK